MPDIISFGSKRDFSKYRFTHRLYYSPFIKNRFLNDCMYCSPTMTRICFEKIIPFPDELLDSEFTVFSYDGLEKDYMKAYLTYTCPENVRSVIGVPKLDPVTWSKTAYKCLGSESVFTDSELNDFEKQHLERCKYHYEAKYLSYIPSVCEVGKFFVDCVLNYGYANFTDWKDENWGTWELNFKAYCEENSVVWTALEDIPWPIIARITEMYPDNIFIIASYYEHFPYYNGVYLVKNAFIYDAASLDPKTWEIFEPFSREEENEKYTPMNIQGLTLLKEKKDSSEEEHVDYFEEFKMRFQKMVDDFRRNVSQDPETYK